MLEWFRRFLAELWRETKRPFMSDPDQVVDQDKPDRRIVVTALGVTQILAWGSTFYLLGVLANPIVRDTGWTSNHDFGRFRTVSTRARGGLSPVVLGSDAVTLGPAATNGDFLCSVKAVTALGGGQSVCGIAALLVYGAWPRPHSSP